MKYFHHQAYMQRAVLLARQSMHNNGGPFGAVIVYNNRVIAEGTNCVTLCNDPTAHAEIVAIRRACEQLKSFSLEGCVLYASCEPCPMCLSAIYWSRLSSLYFAATRFHAANAGFDDAFLYREINKPFEMRHLETIHLPSAEAESLLADWVNKPDKVEY